MQLIIVMVLKNWNAVQIVDALTPSYITWH